MSKIFSIGLAVILSFFTFLLMNQLITKEVSINSSPKPVILDFVTVPKELAPTPKEPIKKYPEPKLKSPTQVPEIAISKPRSTLVKPPGLPAVPGIGDSSFVLPSVGGGNEFMQDIPTMAGNGAPLVRIEPQYPPDAAVKGIEGFVTLSFDVDGLGKATNVKIVEAKPKGYFERVSKKALQKWKFKPADSEGQVQTVTLNFQLAKE
ncbi:energy transducer TonB [Aliikangiella maris]|uniref:TonB family protein n=2 Tax=Aliikangiella maris TaxID=3162458 RepID=A0ABV3MP63_9GAMM